jgi:4-amino-4-deoxy-L-arabinose transferase-like glycosyltransferase
MRPLTAIAMVVIVAGPWFAAVGLKTRGEFLEGFFGVHHFHRFTSPMDNHSGPGWYYLLAICIGFFPWIIFLSPSLGALRRVIRERHAWRPADALVCSWFVVWVGFFSLASTKFPHYVVPAYPALALFTACFLDRWILSVDAYGRLARSGAWATVAAAGVGILIVVPIISRIYLAGEPFVGLAGLPLAVGAALCAYLTERRQIARALASLTGTAIAFLLVLFGISAVRVDRHQNTIPFAEAIRRHAPDTGVRIGAFRYFRPGLVYYCNHRVELLADPKTATGFLQADPVAPFSSRPKRSFSRWPPLSLP